MVGFGINFKGIKFTSDVYMHTMIHVHGSCFKQIQKKKKKKVNTK